MPIRDRSCLWFQEGTCAAGSKQPQMRAQGASKKHKDACEEKAFHERAAGYPYDSSRGKAAHTGTSQTLEHMLY